MIHTLINRLPFKKFLWAIALLGCSTHGFGDQICVHDKCYSIEIADDQQRWSKGLMFRESMDRNAGMLFVFPRAQRHSFWMKNTLIPLDMIWLDNSRRVVHIESNVPPCPNDPCPRYTPQREAYYVLELNAGEAAASGIKVDDQMMIHFQKK